MLGTMEVPEFTDPVNPLLLRTASRSEDISSLSSCALSQD